MQAPPARLVTGSKLTHVIRMTAAGAVGLVAVFGVEAVSLFYISLLGQQELPAALGYSGTLLFFAISVSIGLSITATALTARTGERRPRPGPGIAGASLVLIVLVMSILACLAFPLWEPWLAGWARPDILPS